MPTQTLLETADLRGTDRAPVVELRPVAVLGAGFMIASRFAASPTRPLTKAPPLSGPRWTSVSFFESRTRRSTPAPSSERTPQIPHMSLRVVPACYGASSARL
jgi:hypothetical protein